VEPEPQSVHSLVRATAPQHCFRFYFVRNTFAFRAEPFGNKNHSDQDFNRTFTEFGPISFGHKSFGHFSFYRHSSFGAQTLHLYMLTNHGEKMSLKKVLDYYLVCDEKFITRPLIRSSPLWFKVPCTVFHFAKKVNSVSFFNLCTVKCGIFLFLVAIKVYFNKFTFVAYRYRYWYV
jgi:hypothetical protein